jgi:malonate-semialdehyde dehydrogenase (acetylating)/methylmalonate-semialdehyde dehydrogenase
MRRHEEIDMKTLGNFIHGQMTDSESGRFGAVFNPATGEQTKQVCLSSADETAAAIASAQEAFQTWRKVTPLNRARVMFKFKALLEKHADELAEMTTSEHGKVFSDAKGELTRGLEVVEFACGIPHLQKGEHRLAELLKEAGLPDGVFNVVNGDKESVDVLLTDERVQAVSFVGSTPIAEYIYSTASAHGKRVQALGGAKNHMVVMPDADPAQVVGSLMGAAYGSAGERCMAISVAVCVGDEVADNLVARMSEEIDKMRVGPGIGLDDEAHMGPLISQVHADKVKGYITSGVEEGATLVRDGREFVYAGHENGYFVGPTLFDNVKQGMRIYEEEIFGPVLCVVRAESYAEAIEMINAHEYGNGTAIFTRDGDTARQFCEEIQVGMVGVNVPIPVPMAFHSFGGWKRSLFGLLHMHGPDGVRFYTRMKTVTARWPTGLRAGAEFSMPTMK